MRNILFILFENFQMIVEGLLDIGKGRLEGLTLSMTANEIGTISHKKTILIFFNDNGKLVSYRFNLFHADYYNTEEGIL